MENFDLKKYMAEGRIHLKEEYKGTDLLAALKDLHKRLTAEKFDVAPLQNGRDFDKEITDKVGTDGSMLAAILMDNTKDNSGGTSAKIVVNVLASSKLDKIVKEMGLEDSKYTTGDKIAKSTQEPGSISISGKQEYPKGCYTISLHHAGAK